jgi:shikimate kinase
MKRISLVGPRSVGKSTIGKLLSEKLKLKFIDFDDYCHEGLKKDFGGICGFIDKNTEKYGETGVWDYYWKRQYRFLKEIFSKWKDFVLDMGGGTFAEVFSDRKRNAAIVSKNSLVVGLLPCDNDTEAIDFLFKREETRGHWKKRGILGKKLFGITKRDYLAGKPIYLKRCKIVIYINGRSKEKVVEEILLRLKDEKF